MNDSEVMLPFILVKWRYVCIMQHLNTEPRTHMDICCHLVSVYCMSGIILSVL